MVEWTGGSIPVTENSKVNIVFRDGTTPKDHFPVAEPVRAGNFRWGHDALESEFDIVMYELVEARE